MVAAAGRRGMTIFQGGLEKLLAGNLFPVCSPAYRRSVGGLVRPKDLLRSTAPLLDWLRFVARSTR